MLKFHDGDMTPPGYPGANAAEIADGRGAVYCFVDPAELRRLLSQMAGTELLSELIELLGAAGSAGEVQLPPAFL